jgi:hypothetical protein
VNDEVEALARRGVVPELLEANNTRGWRREESGHDRAGADLT